MQPCKIIVFKLNYIEYIGIIQKNISNNNSNNDLFYLSATYLIHTAFISHIYKYKLNTIRYAA